MKLIVTIVDDQDVDNLMNALTRDHIGVTRVSSTGGLLGPGNSTLLIGVDEGRIAHVKKIIAEQAAPRQGFVTYTYYSSMPVTNLVDVPIGGYLTFVLNIDHFEQV